MILFQDFKLLARIIVRRASDNIAVLNSILEILCYAQNDNT